MLILDQAGMVKHVRVVQSRKLNIERTEMKHVHGIVVHQTDTETVKQTFNSYAGHKPNGAHFLIDKDGTIYQTASLYRRANHVGELRSRCFAQHTCSPAELPKVRSAQGNPKVSNKIEMNKQVPDRYPSNHDSIGIEIVGKAYLPEKYKKPGQSSEALERLRWEYGIFEPVTAAQNASLKWLVEELTSTLQVPQQEIWRHPTLSWKNRTEASTASW